MGDLLMTGRDTIPESWLAHRVAIRPAGRTPVGDMAWQITCPGCGTESQLITDLPGAHLTAEWHAHRCQALRDLSWAECDVCDGRGQVWWMAYTGVERSETCSVCLGRGFARRDVEEVASA